MVEPFLYLPAKKQFPDYYKLIKKPISLNEIKEKDSDDLRELYEDFKLMYHNAAEYNEDGTEIVLDARAIFKVVEDYILAAVSENREETEAYLRELEENENRILNELTVYHQGRRMVTGFLKDFEGTDVSIESIRSNVDLGNIRTPARLLERLQQLISAVTEKYANDSTVMKDCSIFERGCEVKIERLQKQLPVLPDQFYFDKRIEKIQREEFPDFTSDELEKLEQELKLANDAEALASTKTREDVKDVAGEQERGEGPIKKTENGSATPVATSPQPAAAEATAEATAIQLPQRVPDDPKHLYQHNVKTARSLFTQVNITSVIPATSKYHLQKGPPPPALSNLFQVSFPLAKSSYAMQSFSFVLPSYHRALNFTTLLDASLNNRYYNLTLSHNLVFVKPFSVSTASPWADPTKPIVSKYEVALGKGLNGIELTVSASKEIITKKRAASLHTAHQSSDSQILEKITFWVYVSDRWNISLSIEDQ